MLEDVIGIVEAVVHGLFNGHVFTREQKPAGITADIGTRPNEANAPIALRSKRRDEGPGVREHLIGDPITDRPPLIWRHSSFSLCASADLSIFHSLRHAMTR